MRLLLVITILTSLSILSSCRKDDPEPTVRERATELITAGEWSNPVVNVDDVDRSSVYTGFSISFGDGTYAAQSGGRLWKSSGTWEFANEEATAIVFDNDFEVTVTALDSEELAFEFTLDETTYEEGGRTASVRGRNRFRLRRR